jgi:hypothetical protein
MHFVKFRNIGPSVPAPVITAVDSINGKEMPLGDAIRTIQAAIPPESSLVVERGCIQFRTSNDVQALVRYLPEAPNTESI